MLLLLRTDAKGLTGPHPTSKPAWIDHFSTVETGYQSLPLSNLVHSFHTAKASQTTRRTCYLPETERSWAPTHHKEFTMATTTHFDQLQLAERWGLSPKTLERWRVIGTGPKYIRLPGKVIYRLCDIEAYENECLVSSTAEIRKHRELSSI